MAHRLLSPVVVAGVGCSTFGDLLTTDGIAGLTLPELAAQAVHEAYADAGITGPDVDSVYVGNVMVQSSHLPAAYSQLSRWIGTGLAPGVHIDAACSTTNVGLAMAAQAIASGTVDVALVVGVEATRNHPKGYSPFEREPIPSDLMWLWTDMCVDQAYACPQGYDIFTTYNGIVGQAYMRKYGVAPEDYDRAMFELCRTRRLHGSMNPKAMIRQTLEEEAAGHGYADPFDFWTSRLNPFISWPARFRSLVTPADGASAMVLMRPEAARGAPHRPVKVLGFGTASSDLPWYGEDPTTWDLDRRSTRDALEMAGVAAADVDYLHTHDCSHIMSICMAETFGYLNPGEGLKAAAEGRTRFDGDRPMATHGGRHAMGHAWAASAGSDTWEAVKQIRGEAGARQVPRPPETAALMTQGYALISHTVILQGS